jgi:hypothetical protein
MWCSSNILIRADRQLRRSDPKRSSVISGHRDLARWHRRRVVTQLRACCGGLASVRRLRYCLPSGLTSKLRS